MARKAYFAAIPLRAVGDSNLTDGDLRVLASIAAFDRLSHSTGKGQGAWASHRLMSGWIDRNYSNFSATVNKMIRLGYLVREPRETDKRQHTYRVVYTDDDVLPQTEDFLRPEANNPLNNVCPDTNNFREIVCPETGEVQKVVCPAPQSSNGNITESSLEYIPQSGERYSVETGKRNSAKRRDSKIAGQSGDHFRDHLPDNIADLPVSARVACFDRAWRSIGMRWSKIRADDAEMLVAWLGKVFEEYIDQPTGQQALRLSEEIADAIADAKA
ncbi:MarR family transcriptional regulator [Sphingopyxis witflariensis]|uniref:Uncharacterized protein n=1 Tax=Sphingopyxis witflariensis TaxID=173675 RepID=A0A2D0AMY0_9SPHN|nr:helix-turn-helix domain-containing protein [Sphingopyxis witflariensis]OWQ95107.1 hypothetical protein CDQ91_14395 [Sphingopyxis witflariensis]